MKLNQFTDFGLRISMYMAQKQLSGTATTITELSDKFGISRNHLVKVVQFLSNKGIIAAQRGRGGGLRLGESAANIKVGQLVQLLEQSEGLINCQSPHCVLDGSCLLKFVLDNAYREFIAYLDNYSLQDVTAGKTGSLLQQLMNRSTSLPAIDAVIGDTIPED
ncbi:Rrf2 family transcriptional regulator [Pontibacter silvestris]|uniref:Rrf2 family transcriptional regulator n=1 Tax=Pontibacter silvestris TaxID=2305183 RepID=A0ABW4WU87_9BACT|nr:Rrf2 family transcriptional regulator [Pontibacter silvestris]MCC9137721.1 Rrf2 family transcriptional regulator [Pontibacter silvestris]